MKCSNKSVVYVSTSPFPNGFAATNHIIFHARGLLAAGVNCECIIVNRTESLENIKMILRQEIIKEFLFLT